MAWTRKMKEQSVENTCMFYLIIQLSKQPAIYIDNCANTICVVFLICSSLLIVYEGCQDVDDAALTLSPDFHFWSSGRSNSNCELRVMQSRIGVNPPLRSRSDAHITCLNKRPMDDAHMRSSSDDVDMETLAISNISEYNVIDDTQSFSTSPLSVDSGLECLEDCNSSAKHFAQLLRPNGYECDNSTDSTDSGVSGRSKRSNMDSEDTESESELEHLHLYRNLNLPISVIERGIGSATVAIEDDGELTPVLEIQSSSFSEKLEFDSCHIKKRRVEANIPSSELVDVRMIDFAHTTFSGYLGDELVHWGPDNGYLLGLDSLTQILNEIRNATLT